MNGNDKQLLNSNGRPCMAPDEIEDLLFWLVADAEAAYCDPGDPVSRWHDQSGSNNHFNAGSAADFWAGQINGHDAIRFAWANLRDYHSDINPTSLTCLVVSQTAGSLHNAHTWEALIAGEGNGGSRWTIRPAQNASGYPVPYGPDIRRVRYNDMRGVGEIMIGGSPWTNQAWLDNHLIAEIVFYPRALNDEEYARVTNYLKAYYEIDAVVTQ